MQGRPLADIGGGSVIAVTGSFRFGKLSAFFIRDPDRNVIELDAYGGSEVDDLGGYSDHP